MTDDDTRTARAIAAYNRTRELLALEEAKYDGVPVPVWRTWRLKFELWAGRQVFAAYFGEGDGSEKEGDGKAQEGGEGSQDGE